MNAQRTNRKVILFMHGTEWIINQIKYLGKKYIRKSSLESRHFDNFEFSRNVELSKFEYRVCFDSFSIFVDKFTLSIEL